MKFVCAILLFLGCVACAPLANSPAGSPSPSLPSPTINSSPSVIANNQINTWAIATDDANIYWTDCGTNPTAADGRVMKMSKTNGAASVLASQQACPTDLALDAANIFYLVSDSFSSKKIMRVSKNGDAPTTLIGGMDIRSIAADANTVYWTTCDLARNTGAVMKLNPADNSSITLDSNKGCFFDAVADSSGVYWIDDRGVMRLSANDSSAISLTPARFHPRNLISDATNLYWVADNYIMRLPKTGGEPTPLVASNASIGTINIDATNIYWSSNNALYRIAKTGGTQYQIAPTNFVARLAVDEANIFWTNNKDTVTRIAKSTGIAVAENKTDPQTIVFAQEGLNALAIDDANIYWATCRYETEKYNRGGVFKIAKTDGDMITLAQNQPCPGNLALDATNVYWVNQGVASSTGDYNNGAIIQVAKNGGTPTTLTSGQSGRAALAIDDSNVYWTTCGKNRGVMRMAKSGGTPTLWIQDKECPTNITLDASNAFWISGESIKQADKQNGVAQVIVASGGTALISDGANVYWARTDQTSRSGMKSCADEHSVIMKYSQAEKNSTSLASFAGTAPAKIAESNAGVYFGNDCTQGIARVAISGGTSAIVIPNQIPAQIAADATNIYWTVYASGTIMRMAATK